MSRFLTKLQLEAIDGDLWQTLAPLAFESDVLGKTLTVPTGYVTDLASVPRIPLVYEVAGNRAREAAVLHDYLYTMRITSRADADAVLREAAVTPGHGQQQGEPAWRAWLMWAGVRLGGWAPWGRIDDDFNEGAAP